MTDRELFIKTVGDEIPRFERVFKALPTDKLDWRPHPKSRNASEAAISMALEASTFPIFFKTGMLDFGKLPPESTAKSFSEAVSLFRKEMENGKDASTSMTEEDWNSKAVMLNGEKVEWETTKGGMAFGLLLDLIHHRGQLSVYIRPMGGKVPSIYGPSADSAE